MHRVLVHMLAGLGFRDAISRDDGAAALELLVAAGDSAPELIFLDLNMPRMDGIEFLRRLVEHAYAGSVVLVSAEGPRMLRAGNWRRAAELCKAWTELELANAESYRCLGTALQAQGYHQDAINAFRKAKQYDPNDRALDAAIDRSQKGIVADFLNRYRR